MDRIGLALSFASHYPYGSGALTVYWWLSTRRKFKAKQLELLEVAGVQTVGRILAGGGIIPGIIFLSNDTYSYGLGYILGIAATSGAAWQLVHLCTLGTRTP